MNTIEDHCPEKILEFLFNKIHQCSINHRICLRSLGQTQCSLKHHTKFSRKGKLPNNARTNCSLHITQQSEVKVRGLWIWIKSLVLILSRTTVWTKDSTWRECRISWRTYPEGRKHCCEMKWETENRICKKINLKCLETKSSYLLLAATVRKYGFSYLSVIVLFFCLNLARDSNQSIVLCK